MVDLRHGDCRAVLAAMDAESVDAIVTDPPYELAFMGKGWDSAGVSFDPETWRAAHRVLKPGGHLLAFGGTRTFHRIAVAIEDAGFEVRDCLSWLYGSGFPKSHNLPGGIGTALKPAWEPVIVARKPLIGTVAQNVAQHGTGGINVDACRIGTESRPLMMRTATVVAAKSMSGESTGATFSGEMTTQGRWPANVALDEVAAAMLDEMSGVTRSTAQVRHNGAFTSVAKGAETPRDSFGYADTGGASRFFYVAKASRSERNAGLDGMPERQRPGLFDDDGYEWKQKGGHVVANPTANHHPTVKPVALMRWLVRLVTPPGGIVCDPFCGSGTTGIAAALEGVRFIGIEQDAEYLAIAERRIAHWAEQAADDARQLALAAD